MNSEQWEPTVTAPNPEVPRDNSCSSPRQFDNSTCSGSSATQQHQHSTTGAHVVATTLPDSTSGSNPTTRAMLGDTYNDSSMLVATCGPPWCTNPHRLPPLRFSLKLTPTLPLFISLSISLSFLSISLNPSCNPSLDPQWPLLASPDNLILNANISNIVHEQCHHGIYHSKVAVAHLELYVVTGHITPKGIMSTTRKSESWHNTPKRESNERKYLQNRPWLPNNITLMVIKAPTIQQGLLPPIQHDHQNNPSGITNS